MNIKIKYACDLSKGDFVVFLDTSVNYQCIVQINKITKIDIVEELVDHMVSNVWSGQSHPPSIIKWYSVDCINKRLQAHELVMVAE